MPFPLNGKNKALYEMKRGFRLIFQVGGPAFLRSAALFPVVKCVEVYACQIDRLTKALWGLRLIFQVGGPAFLRSAALFPVVGSVETCACQINRFTFVFRPLLVSLVLCALFQDGA